MTSPEAEMWAIYRFREFEVEVIQKWRDPFGRAMVCVQSTDPMDGRSEGFLEESFLREAIPVRSPGER